MRVRKASLDEAPVRSLASEAAAAGYDPARRLLADWDGGSNRFDAPGEIFLAAFGEREPDTCLGFGGLNIDPFCDDPAVGRVRRLYVAAARRGEGIGAALLSRLLAEARSFRHVRVRTPAPAFFVAHGFRPVDDPCATHAFTPPASEPATGKAHRPPSRDGAVEPIVP